MAGGERWRAIVATAATLLVVAALVLVRPSLVPVGVRSALGFGPDRQRAAVVADGEGTYAFMTHQPGDADDPVGYDPCRLVRLEINPQGASPGQVELFAAALERASALSGIGFDYVGTTTDRPKWESQVVPVILGEPRHAPVLVAWADADEVPALKGRVAGVGGSVAVPVAGRFRYVSGGITLDADSFADLHRQGRDAAARAIMLHEIGHLLGLAHVDDERELMYDDNVGREDYGPGDRVGLSRVGSTPCG